VGDKEKTEAIATPPRQAKISAPSVILTVNHQLLARVGQLEIKVFAMTEGVGSV
jgi:hypothetical protein